MLPPSSLLLRCQQGLLNLANLGPRTASSSSSATLSNAFLASSNSAAARRHHRRIRSVVVAMSNGAPDSNGMASSSASSSDSPRPLVMCGPSGSGKSTLMKKLTAEFPDAFGFSVSHTTRKPRPGEQDKVHYHFVERPDLEAAIKRGEFIESAVFSGNLYGTSVAAVEDVVKKGKICILDIDLQGVLQIKEKSGLDCQYVFIRPPSMEVLEARLRDRGTETEDSIARRLDIARKEMEYGSVESNFDAVVVNDDLDRAYTSLRAFVLPEVERYGTTAKKE